MNHLVNETSPYLLQHVHNPVDWYPWGEEALARAKKENKPIFLSIGYSACHWCHVMEHESFENPAIAKKLNENFVCIKVDREERPDLDEIYMVAVQALTGSGGWPMSVFMTPDLKPYFGGTYWPPEDRMGMPGFQRVLDHTIDLWNNRRSDVDSLSKRLTQAISKHLAVRGQPNDPKLEFVESFVEQSRSRFDESTGGFAAPPNFAPKFPHASEIQQLLRAHARTKATKPLQMAERTLQAMADGGIYDQIGGGFHRYSTDREWLVPHFEKMLYDNSLLVQAYLDAYLVTDEPRYAEVCRDVLDYLLREMQDPGGAFWSTTDADSEGEEGKFFVWSRADVDKICGDDAELARLRWGVTDSGNFEGHNVLFRAMPIADIAKRLELEEAQVRARLENARQALYDARKKRIPPGTDDKILTAWTGMVISAFARAHQVLGEPRYLDAARSAADFVLTHMRRDGRLLRTSRAGKAHLSAYLEDYAFFSVALLDVFECDFDPKWLREVKTLLGQIETHFLDEDGSFFFTADDHETLITRSKSVLESATPSGISIATAAFLRAGLLLGDEALYERGWNALRAHHEMLSTSPINCPSLVLALEFALGDPREIVIAGDPESAEVGAFLNSVRTQFPPHHVVVVVHDGNRAALEELTSLATGKEPVDGVPAAYVCRRGTCDAPTTDPAALTLR